jgi:hypothetical protein
LPASRDKRRLKIMKAEDFDEKFDQGESVVEHLDLSKSR